MSNEYVVVSASEAADVGRVLADIGLTVEPYGTKSTGFDFALRCSRGDASVVLAVTRPDQWAQVADARKDLAIVALTRASVLRPWKKGREVALRDEIIAALKPLAWSDPSSGDAESR